MTATRSLASLCAARSILMIYVSTDYVFAGREGEAPYDVDAEPAPPNLYGETKLGGERAMLEEFASAGKEGLGVVVRVPVLYGEAEVPEESAVNVLMNAVWKAQTEGVKVKMDDWSVRYPTNTEDVARVICGECFLSLPALFSCKLSPGRPGRLEFDREQAICHVILTVSLLVYRRRREIPRLENPVRPPADPPLLKRRQDDKVQDLRTLRPHHGPVNRQHRARRRGQRPEGLGAATVRLPLGHEGAEGAGDRGAYERFRIVVAVGGQGVQEVRKSWPLTCTRACMHVRYGVPEG